jgi:hypothetical protein
MIRIISWSIREAAPLEKIASAVQSVARAGAGVWAYAPDTGCDEAAMVVSSRELTPVQAQLLYSHPRAVVRVEVMIEPSWTIDSHTAEIEVGLADIIGLEGLERTNAIIAAAESYVSDACSWGVEEGETVMEPEDG